MPGCEVCESVRLSGCGGPLYNAEESAAGFGSARRVGVSKEEIEARLVSMLATPC